MSKPSLSGLILISVMLKFSIISSLSCSLIFNLSVCPFSSISIPKLWTGKYRSIKDFQPYIGQLFFV